MIEQASISWLSFKSCYPFSNLTLFLNLCLRLRIGRPKTYPTEYAHLLGGLPTVLTETPSSPAAALAAAQAAAVGVTNGSTPSTTTAVIAAQIAASGIGVPKRVEGMHFTTMYCYSITTHLLSDRPDRLVALDLPCSDIVPEIEVTLHIRDFYICPKS